MNGNEFSKQMLISQLMRCHSLRATSTT